VNFLQASQGRSKGSCGVLKKWNETFNKGVTGILRTVSVVLPWCYSGVTYSIILDLFNEILAAEVCYAAFAYVCI
jgi:hypothetical protein